MTSILRRLLALRLKVAMIRSGERPAESGAKILFVIGTGRSGTHFLTRCLIGHQQITDLTGGKENPLLFNMIANAALDLPRAKLVLQEAQKVYDALARLAAPRWLADQSHPNIWFAEWWAKVYPAARFIGILRNPFSVVASMMKHSDVRGWSLEWEHYPIPNPFLGITRENAAEYAEMTLAERCALRWISHYRQLEELRLKLDTRICVVDYEDLCHDIRSSLAPVAAALGLSNNFKTPAVDLGALTRGANMDKADIKAVGRLLTAAAINERWRSPVW